MALMPSFTFSSPELTTQVKRLIAMRTFMYLGAMSCYFIGVLGTLTFAMGAGVGDSAIAVALLNVFVTIGGVRGGSLLDRLGPRRHFRISVALLVACGLLFQVLALSTVGVFAGAALFGFAWGVSDVVPRSYPAYLSDSIDELKRINSLVTLAGNAALVAGPTIGGAIALVAPTQTVFLFMSVCALLALVPGLAFVPLREPADERTGETSAIASDAVAAAGNATARDVAGATNVSATANANDAGTTAGNASATPDDGSAKAGFVEMFASPVLSLLFWATMLSFLGYGAFDPLESLFYRDVLQVGAEWMGWLSALAGVGGVIGAAAVQLLPHRLITVRSLLVVLAASGAGSLLYVSTPYVAVACVGQFTLGFFFSAFGPIKDTLVQVHAPLSRVGRIEAAMQVGYNLAGALPLLCAPALAQMLGVQGTLVTAGVVVVAVPLAIMVLRRSTLASMVAIEHKAEALEEAVAEPAAEPSAGE